MLPGCCLPPCVRRDKRERGEPGGRTGSRVSDEPASASSSSVGKSGGAARRFAWAEIESVTAGFSSRVIGQGGFSTVYLACLSSSRLGAVKVQRSSERLHRAFRQELDVLLSLRHPHVVRLLGYCDERGKVADVVDTRLGHEYDAEEAATMAALALQCVSDSPGVRPSMAEVVRELQEKTTALFSAAGSKPAGKVVS
ncbi:hypothetical protein EJB05_20562, partial [Eragrostis curvula]